MERQYQFAKDATDRGETVLAYNRKAVDQPVKHITADNFARRVAMCGDVMTVDGEIVKGWTMAVKP